MNDKLKQLLINIQEWMIENDYECGEVGAQINDRIRAILDDDKKQS